VVVSVDYFECVPLSIGYKFAIAIILISMMILGVCGHFRPVVVTDDHSELRFAAPCEIEMNFMAAGEGYIVLFGAVPRYRALTVIRATQGGGKSGENKAESEHCG
jgi:hypothetical protein